MWTHWGLNPGPSACRADVIPLHHVPGLHACAPACAHRSSRAGCVALVRHDPAATGRRTRLPLRTGIGTGVLRLPGDRCLSRSLRRVHSSVVRSAGPWFKSACALGGPARSVRLLTSRSWKAAKPHRALPAHQAPNVLHRRHPSGAPADSQNRWLCYRLPPHSATEQHRGNRPGTRGRQKPGRAAQGCRLRPRARTN